MDSRWSLRVWRGRPRRSCASAWRPSDRRARPVRRVASPQHSGAHQHDGSWREMAMPPTNGTPTGNPIHLLHVPGTAACEHYVPLIPPTPSTHAPEDRQDNAAGQRRSSPAQPPAAGTNAAEAHSMTAHSAPARELQRAIAAPHAKSPGRRAKASKPSQLMGRSTVAMKSCMTKWLQAKPSVPTSTARDGAPQAAPPAAAAAHAGGDGPTITPAPCPQMRTRHRPRRQTLRSRCAHGHCLHLRPSRLPRPLPPRLPTPQPMPPHEHTPTR